MRSRNVVITLLVILLLLALAAVLRRYEPKPKEAFDRQPAKLIYYHRALCLMQCMGASRAQVEEVMRRGIINFSKSNKGYKPCPQFALQFRSGGAYLRVIFAQCGSATKVVDVENLEKAFSCNCSGDKN